jgi:hypothetical protein
MSPRNQPKIALIAGASAILAVLLFVFLLPDPRDVAPEPEAPPVAQARPAAPAPPSRAPDRVGSSEPEEVVLEVDIRQTIPNPTPVPPVDPMAEFRVDPFAGRVIHGVTYAPIEGARISAFLFEAGRYEMASGYPPLIDEVTSSPDGTFKFPEQEILPGEVLGWRAEVEGLSTVMLLFPGGAGLGDRLRSTFQLMPTAPISGLVVDEEDTPVGGALVGDIVIGATSRAGTASEQRLPSVFQVTGADGRFRLEGLEDGKGIRLPVRAEGYMVLQSDPLLPGMEDVLLRLVRSDTRLRGTVVDWEGRPVEGARLELTAIETRAGDSQPIRRLTNSGPGGVFQFEGLVTGNYNLQTELDVPETLGPGCYDLRHIALLPGSDMDLTIQLPGPSRIAGRFVDSTSGEGIPGVVLFSNIDDVSVRDRAFRVESGREGDFAFTAFVPADLRGYEVRLPVDWGEKWFPLPREVQDELIRTEQDYLSFMAIQPGEERVDVEVLLAPGGILSGVVLEPESGLPAVEVPVYFRADRFFNTVTTNEMGEFRVGVPNGIRLRVESSSEEGIGFLMVQTQLEMPPVRLQLEPYCTVEGTLEEEDGTPIGEFVISTRRPGGEDSFVDAIRFEERTLTNADGTWRIEQVAHGPLSLIVEVSHAHGYAPVTPKEIFLTPGEQREGIRLVMEAGDYIDGRVVDDADGKPLEGVTLFTSLREISAATDGDGRFRLEGVPYDTALQYVTASIQDYGEETRRNVSIYDGEVVFRLKRLAETSLRVVDGAGTPVSSYRARLIGSRADMPGLGSQTLREILGSDPSGVASMGNLSSGDYRVEVIELLASGGEGRKGSEDFTVMAAGGGASQQVIVRLDLGRFIQGVVLRGNIWVPPMRGWNFSIRPWVSRGPPVLPVPNSTSPRLTGPDAFPSDPSPTAATN